MGAAAFDSPVLLVFILLTCLHEKNIKMACILPSVVVNYITISLNIIQGLAVEVTISGQYKAMNMMNKVVLIALLGVISVGYGLLPTWSSERNAPEFKPRFTQAATVAGERICLFPIKAI